MKSIKEREKELLLTRLEVVLKHHVALGVNHIFCSTIAGKNPSLISFHHLLNRLVTAIQLPVCFCVFRKEPTNELSLLYISNTHYRHRKTIRDKAFQIIETYKNDTTDYFDLKQQIIPILSNKKKEHFNISSRSPVSEDLKDEWEQAKVLEDLKDEWEQAKYYLGVLNIKKREDVMFTGERHYFEWLEPVRKIKSIRHGWDIAGYKLVRLMQHEKYAMFGEEFFTSVFNSVERMQKVPQSETLSESEERFNNEKFKRIIYKKYPSNFKENYEEIYKIYYSNLLKNNTSFHYLEGKSTLDKVFQKSKPNVNLVADNQSEKCLTNFLCFVRDYDVDMHYKRYEQKKDNFKGYNYRVRIALCSEQTKEIFNFFDEKCKKYERNPDEIIENTRYGNNDIKIYIWDTLFEFYNQKSLGLVVELIGAHFTKYTMSFSDNCFRDCTTQYVTPFNNLSGANRSRLIDTYTNGLKKEVLDLIKSNDNKIFSSEQIENFKDYISTIYEKPEIEQRLFDSFRAFLVSILFSEMSSGDTNEKYDLHAQLNPIELGGKVWGVVTYVTNISKVDKIFQREKKDYSNENLKNDIQLYNSIFLENFNQASLLMDRVKKNIRINMKQQFFNDISTVYARWYKRIIKDLINFNFFDFFNFIKAEKYELNQKLAILSFFYPYKPIQIVDVVDISELKKDCFPPYSSKEPKTSHQCYLIARTALQLDYCHDSMFSTVPSYKQTTADELFFDLSDIAVKLSKVSHQEYNTYIVSMDAENTENYFWDSDDFFSSSKKD